MGRNGSLSFAWIIALITACAIIYAVRTWLGYKGLTHEAVDDWDYKRKNNMDDPQLSEDEYVQIYRRINAPRPQLYVAIVTTMIALLTLPFLAISSATLELLYRLSGRSDTILPGFLAWQFALFFMIIGFWALIATFASRRFHKYAPSTYRNEVIKLKVARDEGRPY